MRANRVNGYEAVVLSLGLLLLSAASSLGQVVNENFIITDMAEPDTKGTANHTGASNSGTGQTTCRDGSNTVTVSGVTTHPEFVRLAKNSASMKQGSIGNLPTLRVIGAGAQVFNVVLTCGSAAFESNVNNAPNVNIGVFQVQGANCSGLTEARASYLHDTCTADVDNKTIKISIDGAIIEKLTIRGKGSTAP